MAPVIELQNRAQMFGKGSSPEATRIFANETVEPTYGCFIFEMLCHHGMSIVLAHLMLCMHENIEPYHHPDVDLPWRRFTACPCSR